MKIILNSFGVMDDKRFLKAIEGKAEFEWRTDESVIELIESKHDEIKFLTVVKNQGKVTKGQLSKLEKLTNSYDSKCWLYFRIEEVDTKRPWYLSDYDTSLSICYLDKSDIKKDINFYGFH